MPIPSDYEFTQDWFSEHEADWLAMMQRIGGGPIRSALEVGSFEGRSTVWIIENMLQGKGNIVCIDTWQGGVDHIGMDMGAIECRFDRNMKIASRPGLSIHKVKSRSSLALANLLATDRGAFEGHFDLIYIDGSHKCAEQIILNHR